MKVGAMLCLSVAIAVGAYAIQDYSTNARNLSVAQYRLPAPYLEAQMNGYGERERTEAALGIMAFVLVMGSLVLFTPENDQGRTRNSSKVRQRRFGAKAASHARPSGKTVLP